uniref:Uncharacterized protein n=1 Tax=viral metagenome TaxID=1070528 RepID=A0A6H2A153_9ZZZZ
MTMQRRDNRGTVFTNWIRQPEELSSEKGYVATDIDLLWENYKLKKYMFIEEKTFMAKPTDCQLRQMNRVHRINFKRNEYCGYHLIQFEKNSPEDGRIFLDGKEISKERLLTFLQFVNVDKNSLEKLEPMGDDLEFCLNIIGVKK